MNTDLSKPQNSNTFPAGLIAVMFGIAIALIFYVFLRWGSKAPLVLILNGEPVMGAVKLAGYALFAAGIQMLILWRSPRLGSHGLFAIVLLLTGVIIIWGLRSHLYFYDASDLLLLLTPVLVEAILVGLAIATWKKRAHTSPLGRGGMIFALIISVPVLLLDLWVAFT